MRVALALCVVAGCAEPEAALFIESPEVPGAESYLLVVTGADGAPIVEAYRPGPARLTLDAPPQDVVALSYGCDLEALGLNPGPVPLTLDGDPLPPARAMHRLSAGPPTPLDAQPEAVAAFRVPRLRPAESRFCPGYLPSAEIEPLELRGDVSWLFARAVDDHVLVGNGAGEVHRVYADGVVAPEPRLTSTVAATADVYLDAARDLHSVQLSLVETATLAGRRVHRVELARRRGDEVTLTPLPWPVYSRGIVRLDGGPRDGDTELFVAVDMSGLFRAFRGRSWGYPRVHETSDPYMNRVRWLAPGRGLALGFGPFSLARLTEDAVNHQTLGLETPTSLAVVGGELYFGTDLGRIYRDDADGLTPIAAFDPAVSARALVLATTREGLLLGGRAGRLGAYAPGLGVCGYPSVFGDGADLVDTAPLGPDLVVLRRGRAPFILRVTPSRCGAPI